MPDARHMERYVLIDHTADMMVRAFGSTLEECFGNAAYATIRAFVLKFEGMGLLHRTKYGNRVKYSVK